MLEMTVYARAGETLSANIGVSNPSYSTAKLKNDVDNKLHNKHTTTY